MSATGQRSLERVSLHGVARGLRLFAHGRVITGACYPGAVPMDSLQLCEGQTLNRLTAHVQWGSINTMQIPTGTLCSHALSQWRIEEFSKLR
jgi:hypothetical protein